MNTVVFLEPKGTALEIVRAAKRRGLRVVAISSDPKLISEAPEPYQSAGQQIDEVIKIEDWKNEGLILQLCTAIHSKTPIVGFYSGMDPCALALAYLRAEFDLPTHRRDDIATALNKFTLRKKLYSAGLSRIRNYHSSEVEKWTSWPFQGAAYFKPVHGFFSAYVRRCENWDDLRASQDAWNTGTPYDPGYVRDFLRSINEYHVEEAFEGELLSVEAIASNGHLQVLGLLSRILYSKNPVVEMGSCFPYPHPLAEKVIDLVTRAHKLLGLTDGPTHTEVMVNSKSEVEIIDLNCRFVGADVLQSINHAYDINIEEPLLDYALGKTLVIKPQGNQYSCLQYFLPPEVPTFDQLAFPKGPEVQFQTTFIQQGTKIQSTNRQLDYLGCYLTVMPTFESAIARSRELRQQVVINQNHQGVF